MSKSVQSVQKCTVCPIGYNVRSRKIETLLGTKAVTNAQAAKFLLEASETMVTSDPDEAFRYAQVHKWLPKNVTANGVAR